LYVNTNEAIGLAITFTPNYLQLQKHTDNTFHIENSVFGPRQKPAPMPYLLFW